MPVARAKRAAPRKANTAASLDEMAGGHIAIADLAPADLFDIDSVEEHPENPRDGDVLAIMESIQAHGVYRSLIVQRATPSGDRRMRVVAGNHTRRAAKQLGYRMLPMDFIDCTDAKARRILLVDNKTNDRAHYDDAALLELLKSVAEEADGLVGTGFSAEELDAMLAVHDDAAGDADGRGELLEAEAFSLQQPNTEVEPREVWDIGPHVLVCCDPVTQWNAFTPHLRDGARLFLYPDILAVYTLALDAGPVVFVQPDAWIAGHLLDRARDRFGATAVTRRGT